MEVERFIYGAKKMEVYPNVSPVKLIHLWFNSSNFFEFRTLIYLLYTGFISMRWKHNYMMLVL